MVWSNLTSRKTAGLNALRASLVNEAGRNSDYRADWAKDFCAKQLADYRAPDPKFNFRSKVHAVASQ